MAHKLLIEDAIDNLPTAILAAVADPMLCPVVNISAPFRWYMTSKEAYETKGTIKRFSTIRLPWEAAWMEFTFDDIQPGTWEDDDEIAAIIAKSHDDHPAEDVSILAKAVKNLRSGVLIIQDTKQEFFNSFLHEDISNHSKVQTLKAAVARSAQGVEYHSVLSCEFWFEMALANGRNYVESWFHTFVLLDEDGVAIHDYPICIPTAPFVERQSKSQAQDTKTAMAESHKFAVSMSRPLLASLSLMNLKNIEIVDEPSNISRPYRRHLERQGKPFVSKIKTLWIKPLSVKVKKGEKVPRDQLIRVSPALHLSRGTFHEYGPKYGKGLLFGKYEGRYWIQPHVKGNRTRGTVQKQYVVAAPAQEVE